jgi:hypothetical protein
MFDLYTPLSTVHRCALGPQVLLCIKISVFWEMTQCSLVYVHRLSKELATLVTLEMGAACSSETPVNIWYTHTISLFPLAPNLELRTTVKRFVSLRFLNRKTVSRTPWMGDQPISRPLPTQT